MDATLARVELVAHACTGAVGVDEILTILVRQALVGLDAARATVAHVAPDGAVMPVLSACGEAPDALVPLGLPEAVVLALVAHDRSSVVHETADELVARFPALAELGRPRGAVAAVPLVRRGVVVAVLAVAFDGTRRFDPLDRSFLQALADVGALALGAAS